MALPRPTQETISKYGTSDLYYNGSEWIPQYTGAKSQPMSSTAYHTAKQNGGWYDGVQYWDPGQGPTNQTPTTGSNNEVAQVDPYAQVRNEISSAWDNYLSSLGEQEQYIDQQKTAQDNLVNNQYLKGETTIGSQKADSLKDIYKTTRNAFQAGNRYLGQLGAGDSSANGMFNYAVTKQATEQVGNLNNFTNQQLQQLAFDRDSQLQGIQQWFAQSQQALKNQYSQGLLQKGTDIAQLSKSLLEQALNATQQVRTNAMNRENALLSWSMSNSSNLSQLQQNIAGTTNMFKPGQIQMSGNTQNQIGYGGTTNYSNEKYDMFGNRIA